MHIHNYVGFVIVNVSYKFLMFMFIVSQKGLSKGGGLLQKQVKLLYTLNMLLILCTV